LNGQWCGNRAQILFGRCGSFVEPVVVIPDIGGAANEYFVVKNRDAWKQDFEEWLEHPTATPHLRCLMMNLRMKSTKLYHPKQEWLSKRRGTGC
jgi:hypothetical protein